MKFPSLVVSLVVVFEAIIHVESFSTGSNAGIANYGTTITSRKVQNSVAPEATESISGQVEQRRALGSQENLMLPRQYSINSDVVFPQMNHVSCAILSSTPTEAALLEAINGVMKAHPLLRCKIEGDGEPDERIDLFKMVRKGEPTPCTFVSKPDTFSATDVLRTVDVAGSDRESLDKSWQSAFNRDLDDGSWCDAEKTPLWKFEIHRSQDGSDAPSALLLSFNHAISDQSSANKLTDQIVNLLGQIDSNGSVKSMPKEQSIPPSVEQSVLGDAETWSDIGPSGVSIDTIKYVGGKALEETKGPVILPDGFSSGGSPLGALTTISGNAAGGEDSKSMERKSVVEFRTLSKEASSALLAKCRESDVSITNALSAAITMTSTDFVDGGSKIDAERNYKVLQSLDMRRFGACIDKGESVGCLAGSMDLMHGPLPDRSGEKVRFQLVSKTSTKAVSCLQIPFYHSQLRTSPTTEDVNLFWDIAKEGKSQTAAFIESDGPSHAVRVFDFAMTIADLNNLVHLTAQSKDTQGRAYSAGFTNAGVYERLDAFEMESEDGRTVQVRLQYPHVSFFQCFTLTLCRINTASIKSRIFSTLLRMLEVVVYIDFRA